jgi:hypothetical protein
MKTAKTTLFATLAIAAAAIAAPAAAQSYGYDHRDSGRYEQRHDNARYEQHGRWDDGNLNARQAEISRKIEWGIRRGALDRREAQSLRIESRDIAQLEAQYRRGGLTGPEYRGLDHRLDRLEAALERDLNDREYGAGYGNDHYRR